MTNLFLLFHIFDQPMHDDYDLRQEQLNKGSILSSRSFLENLLEMFNNHVVSVEKAFYFLRQLSSLLSLVFLHTFVFLLNYPNKINIQFFCYLLFIFITIFHLLFSFETVRFIVY